MHVEILTEACITTPSPYVKWSFPYRLLLFKSIWPTRMWIFLGYVFLRVQRLCTASKTYKLKVGIAERWSVILCRCPVTVSVSAAQKRDEALQIKAAFYCGAADVALTQKSCWTSVDCLTQGDIKPRNKASPSVSKLAVAASARRDWAPPFLLRPRATLRAILGWSAAPQTEEEPSRTRSTRKRGWLDWTCTSSSTFSSLPTNWSQRRHSTK